jgi:hypothetical protein
VATGTKPFHAVIGWMLTYSYFQKVNFTPTGSCHQEQQGNASAEADESFAASSFSVKPKLFP